MAIYKITTDFPGQVGVRPNIVRIWCDDSFATITAANYLLNAQNQGFVFNDGDIAAVIYGAPPSTQLFTIAISSGTITLEPMAGEVTLPTVAGDFAVFSGTTGGLDDAGYSPSDATKTKVVMANDATVADNLATFADTAGTVKDAGTRIIAGRSPTFGGGSTSHTFAVTGLTAASIVVAVPFDLTNPAAVVQAVPGTNTLDIEFSADPGANTVVTYIALTAAIA